MLTTMVSIAARITALELAVIAVANQELGDSAGHPFRGNQYGGGGGERSDRSDRSDRGDAVKPYNESKEAADKYDKALSIADKLTTGSNDTNFNDGVNYAAAQFEDGSVRDPQLLLNDANNELTDVRDQLNSTIEPGSPGEAQAAKDERFAEGQVAHAQEMVKAFPAEPEQRHGLAQDKHSYDSDDVETFSIDDDGTVTFGDSPGHPFRGNQYSGGMSHEEAHTRAENHGANFQREHPDVAKQVGREATRYLDRYMNDSPNTEASSTRDQMLNRYRASDNGTKIGPASTPSGYLPHNPVQTYASPLASGAARMQQGTASDSEVRAVGNFMRRTEETQ